MTGAGARVEGRAEAELDRLELLTDDPRPAEPDGAVGSVCLTAGSGIVDRLTRVAATGSVRPSDVAIAAFAVVMSRWSDRPAFAMTVADGAARRVLSLDVAGSLPFGALVRDVASQMHGAPAEPSARPDGDDRVVFEILSSGEVAGEAASPGVPDLHVTFAADDPDGACRLAFATALFARETIERIGTAFLDSLDALSAGFDAPVATWRMLPATDRALIVDVWSGAAADGRALDTNVTVDELVRRAARARPEAVAIVEDGGESVSYGTLAERASRLARRLIRAGVTPEASVGLFFERSAAAIVAMLATLEAGGAYVPLDPAYPPEATRLMLETSGARVIATDGAHASAARDFGTDVVVVDGSELSHDKVVSDDADVRHVGVPRGERDARSLAYVLFTSGSTGRPKGVAVEHRSVVALVTGTPELRPAASDVVVLLGPLTFDASVFEIWSALANGATLVVPRPGPLSLAEFAGVAERHAVTWFDISTALFHHVIDERPESLRGARVVIVGGDVLSPRHARRLLEAVPGCRFFNDYGPTECTVHATIHRIVATDEVGRPVPIGRPIPGSRAYILDERGEPVPQGVPGELVLGGRCVARGYVGDAERTAERFVPDAFAAEPSARLYRTGDRVRWLDGGAIEFLGRADAQVKIRGFRIEAGEIESALLAHAGVRAAAVAMRPSAVGADRELVAYAETASAGPDEDVLRRFLARKLPPHAVPSRIVTVRELARTTSGKIDRGRLPAVPDAAPIAENERPRSELERRTAAIVAALLGREAVGRSDDFFAIGGNSLLAMRAVARIAEAFGTELTLRAFFAARTIADVAALVEAEAGSSARGAASDATATPVVVGGDGARISSGQRRLWLLDQLEPSPSAYNVPFATRLAGALDRGALERAIADLAERHAILRSTIVLIDGEPALAEGRVPVRLRVVALDGATPGDVAAAIDAERRAPFDLARGPLVRALLATTAADRHVLLFTMHHSITDGWSMNVFSRELSRLYRDRARGAVPEGPPAGRPYADLARIERAEASSPKIDRQRAYWRARFAEPRVPFALPGERVATETTATTGSDRKDERVFSAAQRTALEAFCRGRRSTRLPVLLAAYAVLLYQRTGSRDLILGTPLANRSRPEFEDTIGFFVNTVALRIRLDPAASFERLLDDVAEALFGALEHQDVPFDRVVADLPSRRRTGRTPLIDSLFVVQDPTEPLDFAGLSAETLDVEQDGASSDLTFEVTDTGADLWARVFYRDDRFDPDVVSVLPAHYLLVLDAVLGAPGAPLAAHGEPLAHPARAATEPTERPRGFVAPRTELERQIALVWERVLGMRAAGVRDDFFALGGSSLQAIEMMADVERAVGARVPLAALFGEPTIERLALALVKGAREWEKAPLLRLNDGGTRPPIVFLHGSVKGGGFYCNGLARRLGPDQPLYVFRPHGVDGKDVPDTIGAMAREYVERLRAVRPNGPYVVGGYSGGGLVAYEMASLLRAAGAFVPNVVLIDAPFVDRPVRAVVEAIVKVAAIARVPEARRAAAERAVMRFGYRWQNLREQARPFAYLRRRALERLGVVVREEDSALMLRWGDVSDAYVPGRYDGPLTVLLPREEIPRGVRTPRTGWRSVARLARVRVVPGDHHTCVTEYVADVARAMAEAAAGA